MNGNLERLEQLLGRRFDLSGRVVLGDKRGRTIGFPTANIKPKRQLVPPHGVYATIAVVSGELVPAVTNVGVRPTFGQETLLVETHLLTENSYSLYGERLQVQFVQKIREEKKFSGLDELKLQITKDAETARAILSDIVQ